MTDAVADAAALGLPGEFLDELAASQPKGFEVWPVNMPVVDAWFMIATQWNAEAMPDGGVHWIGLNYGGVTAGFHLAQYVPTADIWSGLQIMERIATRALNGAPDRIDDA